MYKSHLLTLLCTVGGIFQANAQLFILPSNNIGIGTNAPSHQLHTTGSVRFQNLTGTGNRLLQTDATGVLAPIAGGTVGQVLTQSTTGLAWTTPATASADWSLTGNTGNAATHFLGTTDNNSIIVKTAGVERFRVRPQSNSTLLMSNLPNPIGSWDTDPNANVIGVSMEIQRAPITYGANIGLAASVSAVNGASVSGTAAAHLATTQSWYAAGNIVGVTGGVSISKIAQSSKVYSSGGGVFALELLNAALTSPAENFVGGVVSTLSGSIANSQNMVIASVLAEDKINSNLTWAAYMRGKAYISGNLAVGTTIPTAQLHTVGTVRHQNLPSGTGKALVVDANGNVFVSNTLAGLAPSANNNATELLNAQKQEINDLKTRLERLEKLLSNSTSGIAPKYETENISLEQNRPNPANGFTAIDYSLPNTYSKAMLNIVDVAGKVIHSEPLTNSKGTVEMNTTHWTEGIYIYTLVADGKVLKTKKMIINKN
jgi:Secretion system C-terminal sorting domain